MDQNLKEEMQLAAAAKKDGPKLARDPKEKNTAMAAVAYIVFFVPLLTDYKSDPFVKFHVKQGLVLFLAWFAAGIVSMVPFLGWALAPLLMLAVFVLMVIGIIGAMKGEQKPLPFIGKYADQFKI